MSADEKIIHDRADIATPLRKTISNRQLNLIHLFPIQDMQTRCNVNVCSGSCDSSFDYFLEIFSRFFKNLFANMVNT